MAGDVDAVLHELGDGGRFQVVTYLLLSVPMVYVVISSTSFVFTSGDLNYRCRVPECDGNGTGFEAEWVEWALPPGHHECVRYEVKVNTSLPKEPGSCPASMFVNATVPCDEFIFEDDELTILREWNLTCKANKWKLSVAGTLIYSGALLSKPLAGFVSDRYGRKVLLLGGLALAALTGAVRGMASTYTMFQVCNLLEGVFGGGIYSAAFVMGLELLGPRRRVLGGAFMSSLNAAGEVLMGAIAWGFRSWRMIHMVVYAPSLLFVAYIWLLPESVRWLLAKGREEEATAILRRAARMNGVTLSEGHMAALHKVTEAEDDPAPHRGVLQQVLRSRVLMVRLLLCSFCWASVGFTFSGLTFNATSLAGNKYVNFMLAGFIELPGHVITYLGMAHVGRRLTLGASLAVSGAACFLFVAVPAGGACLGVMGSVPCRHALAVYRTLPPREVHHHDRLRRPLHVRRRAVPHPHETLPAICVLHAGGGGRRRRPPDAAAGQLLRTPALAAVRVDGRDLCPAHVLAARDPGAASARHRRGGREAGLA